jgi:RNA polymerase sigma-70 factor (ECF subfamily)
MGPGVTPRHDPRCPAYWLKMDRAIELRLVARLKAADEHAFEAVYGAYRPRLYSFLVRLTRRPDVAEDLLEETWLRLVRRVDTLKNDAALAPWLFTVARNLYCSWRRSRAVDEARTTDLDPAWPAPERGDSPFQATARAELERRVERALARLPLKHREVLLLVGFEGLTPSEAAEVCGLPSTSLRARLHRARARLMAEMDPDHAAPRAKAG